MKKIPIILSVILYIILLAPIALAELELDEIKVYVEDDRDSSVDKDGGNIDVLRGDNLEFVIRLDNNMDNTTRVRIIGTINDIDDGSDITKEHNWFDIDANDDKSKALSFNIPTDADFDDYNMELTIDFEYKNGTEDDFEIDFDIDVNEEDTTTSEEDLVDSLDNMSKTCTNIISVMSNSFDYIGRYGNCTDDLSTCKEERGTHKTSSDECDKTLIDCKADKEDFRKEMEKCETAKGNMIQKTTCEEQKTLVEKETSSKKTGQAFGVGIAAIAVWWYWDKRKKQPAVIDKTYNQKTFRQ